MSEPKACRLLVITISGVILEGFSKYLSIPRNFNTILDSQSIHSSSTNPLNVTKQQLEELELKTRKYFRKTNLHSNKELDDLNEVMFKKELQRTLALGQYKREYILNKILLYQKRLEALENRVPTKRQWDNVYKIQDQEKRKEREEKFNMIIRETQAINIEMDDLHKDLTEIEFDLPDDVKRLEFYRKLSKRTQLISIGRLVQN